MPTIIHISAESFPLAKQQITFQNYSRISSSTQTMKLFRSNDLDSWLLMLQDKETWIYIKKQDKEAIVKGDVSIIVNKLKNIWTPRQTVTITRTEYENTQQRILKTIQLQVGSVNRGILLISEQQEQFGELGNTHWEADETIGLFHIVMKILLNKAV
jgi:hypothetical protein